MCPIGEPLSAMSHARPGWGMAPAGEGQLNWNKAVRQLHRWLSILFTAVVAGIFLALGLGREPAPWIYYLPLAPLALMMLTGLWMFFRPYAARSPRTER
ncbi:hypothetical protein SAMN06295937_101528 [Sphingopyxis flava]|uniref:Uncharacterized protein n=2 Tax=Sphingopyxis flava TaxID=1507287 RepID=A0A1T5DLB9_9SPHN|nr:hypothetical protein SAMN06295937_101528 [Sphingopyxis flava]